MSSKSVCCGAPIQGRASFLQQEFGGISQGHFMTKYHLKMNLIPNKNRLEIFRTSLNKPTLALHERILNTKQEQNEDLLNGTPQIGQDLWD